jgi:parvulin-like peptidyl-prolyl isomerase
MSPKIPLTPEKKAMLKREILDGINSSPNLKISKPEKISVGEIKKPVATTPKSSKLVKPAVAKSKITKSIKTKRIIKPAVKNKIISDISNISNPSNLSLEADGIKPKTNPLIQRIRGLNAPNKREAVDDFFAKPVQKEKKGFGFYCIRMVIFLVLLAILALCVDIYGIYRLNWQDKISQQVAHILPLPAATINGKVITLADYLDDINVLQTALNNQREGLDGGVISPTNKDSVIDRLVVISLISEQLAKYGKSVTEQDLNDNLDGIVAQFNGKTEAEDNVKKLYGINLNQFKTKVLKPLLAKNLLQSLIVKDESLTINKEAKAKATDVLALALKPGANFAELAKKYTEDEAGINTGGDLGFISKGQTTSEIEQILFSLPANTVYDKIITNNVGYHIIMVENKLVSSQDGKESVRAKQIFIKVDVDKYLRDLLAQAKIVKYVK